MEEQPTNPAAAPIPTATSLPVQPQQPNLPIAPTVTSEPRNFLAAFLMTYSIGISGLHQLYLGRKTQAWVRFGLFVVMYPLSLVIVGFFIMPVVYVWWLVDIFLVYLKRKDGTGQDLIITTRDAFAAKILFIVTLVGLALVIPAVLITIALSSFHGIQQKAQSTSQQTQQSTTFTQ